MNVKNIEVWHDLLNKFRLSKVLRILLNCYVFGKMVTKRWSYARVLLENPNIKQQLVDFLEIQASKISGLYLQKVNFSWKENIQFHEESQKYVYYERYVNPGGEHPLERNELTFMTLASSYFRSYVLDQHLCFTSDVRIMNNIQESYVCRYLMRALQRVRKACYRCQRKAAIKNQPINVKQGSVPASRVQAHPPFSYLAFVHTLRF